LLEICDFNYDLLGFSSPSIPSLSNMSCSQGPLARLSTRPLPLKNPPRPLNDPDPPISFEELGLNLLAGLLSLLRRSRCLSNWRLISGGMGGGVWDLLLVILRKIRTGLVRRGLDEDGLSLSDFGRSIDLERPNAMGPLWFLSFLPLSTLPR